MSIDSFIFPLSPAACFAEGLLLSFGAQIVRVTNHSVNAVDIAISN